MPHPCCFCDAPIDARFDFCKACKAQYDAALDPGWESSDWFQETVKISRRAAYQDRREIPFSDLSAGLAIDAPLPAPLAPDLLDQLITRALEAAPDTGWRRMHRIIQQQGIDATARKVRCRLDHIRKQRGT